MKNVISKFKEDWLEALFAVSLLVCAAAMPVLVITGFASNI